MLDFLYYPALIVGGFVLAIFTLGIIYVILCAIFEHLSGHNELQREVDSLKERQRNLEGTIGDMRYKVEKYQRTKEYHKETPNE